ncbi:Geraniol 8-hydroxylase [Camellia lanceoleosa]|uniref:Geraniol 8-hydroxylase n=1 Tax=Camellia lanceoleosa TaxID=1840588 RepID=A0ACC0HXS3_9ERIC|nr:Geraniol 8-hydroxylase [Camellia lanceoleosa]
MEILSIVFYLLLTLTLLQTLLSLARGSRTCQKLPPEPAMLPVIGNILKLGHKPHESLADLTKIHGPIMSLKLGQLTTIVVSSSTMAKQILQKQDLAFSTRSIPDSLHAHDHNHYSVAWLPVADRWRSLRKIMASNIFSGNRLDIPTAAEGGGVHFLRRKCSQEGVAVDIGRVAFTTSLNLLSNTVFSMDLADPSLDSAKEFKDLVSNIMEEAGKPNLVDYFPVLEKIDPQGIRGQRKVHFAKILQLFGRLIDERLELRKLRKTSEENDVLDILLDIIEQNSEDIDRIHMEHLFLVCLSSPPCSSRI